MRKTILSTLCFLLLAPLALAQQHKVSFTTPAGKTYFKGRVAPKNLKALMQASAAAHAHKLRALPTVTAASYDCRTIGLVGPVQDQGQCGSCWDFSGCAVATFAMYKSGMLKNDGTAGNYLCQQAVLDCGQNGGCNGDDNTSVLDMCKKQGLPVQADYGPYTASSGRCKQVAKVYKLKDWGFCDGQSYDRVSDTQKIKDAMVAYGPIGCAVAAGGDNFWNTGQGTGTARSNQIDHDVTLVGWDDNHDNGDGSKGAWIMLNSWGKGWGSGCGIDGSGCAWVKYGAYSLGTEAVWAVADPGPNPPPLAPVISSAAAASVQVGAPFSYQIVASNTPTQYGAATLPAGLTCNVTTGFVNGTVATAGSYTFTVSATNVAGTGTQAVALTVSDGPPPPPPNYPSLDLAFKTTPEQTKTIIDALGAQGFHMVNGDMTIRDLMNVLEKCKTPATKQQPIKPCCGQQSKAPTADPFLTRIQKAYSVETDTDALPKLQQLYADAVALPSAASTWGELFVSFNERANDLGVAEKLPRLEAVIRDAALAAFPQSERQDTALTPEDREAAARFFARVTTALKGAN